jgi:probable phosphoglycerate mutase
VVLLVRHGRTPTTGQVLPGRAAGLHLSDVGRAQADAVAERIGRLAEGSAAHGPIAVYASPLERTTETARPIARCLGLRVRADQGLLECDFGRWTGAKLADLAKKPEWATVQRNPSGFRFPSGESFLEMQTRMTSALARLVERHRGETVVAVSHADPIKAVVAQAAGTPLDLFQRLMVAPCSVSALAYTGAGPYVLTVNSTDSLTALAIA